MRDRLIELIKQAKKHTKNANSDIERNMIFADYLLANGVIVPPCKVGDKVWTKYGYTFEVEGIEILKDKKIFRCGNLGTDDYMAFFEDEIGKDVFFAKEEAEQALNNIQKGNSCEGGVE
jgi:hypothetical protein